MHKWMMFVWVAGSVALAQSAQPSSAVGHFGEDSSREQKRTQLRNALSVNRAAEQPPARPEASPVGYQLSLQERAAMREQLRRYQPGAQRRQP